MKNVARKSATKKTTKSAPPLAPPAIRGVRRVAPPDPTGEALKEVFARGAAERAAADLERSATQDDSPEFRRVRAAFYEDQVLRDAGIGTVGWNNEDQANLADVIYQSLADHGNGESFERGVLRSLSCELETISTALYAENECAASLLEHVRQVQSRCRMAVEIGRRFEKAAKAQVSK